MLAKCRVLSVQPGNKCAANGLKTKEKNTKYAWIILGAGTRVGKQKKYIRNTKLYNVSASISTEKPTKYVILDRSIRVRK